MAERKKDKGRSHIKSMTEEPDTEDDDSESEDEEYGFALRTMQHSPTSTTTPIENHFSPLANVVVDNDVDIFDPDTLAQLGTWAHKVNVKSAKISKKQEDRNFEVALREHDKLTSKLPACGVTISSEKDLDRVLANHPHILAAMPTGRKKIIKASRKMPDRYALADDEIFAMMDSGAGKPALNVQKHCPQLAHLVREARKRTRCIMANGDELVITKELEVLCGLDGQDVPVTFADLPVSCPILSVRRIVRRGNKVVFEDEGGYILEKATGKKMYFIEREGVYFIKMKIKDVPSQIAGFTRPELK